MFRFALSAGKSPLPNVHHSFLFTLFLLDVARRIPASHAPILQLRAAPVQRVVPRLFGSTTSTAEVVTPELVDTLEWVLDSPPTLHQFEEPPIVVEIAHLM